MPLIASDRLLHQVFLSAGVAYLDPAYVAALMKPLVDHRLTSRALAVGFADNPPHAADLLSAVDELVVAGVLREELLPMLWSETGLAASDYSAVLLMLEQAGVLFRTHAEAVVTEGSGGNGSGGGGGGGGGDVGDVGVGGGGTLQRWVMPMRLPERRPVAIPAMWSHQLFRACEGEAAVREHLSLGSFVPPGLIERLLAACYQLGHHHYFWRTGALITLDLGSGGGQARLLLDVDAVEDAAKTEDAPGASAPPAEPAEPEYAVCFEAFGPAGCEAQLAEAVATVCQLMRGLMADFPGMIASMAPPRRGGVAAWWGRALRPGDLD